MGKENVQFSTFLVIYICFVTQKMLYFAAAKLKSKFYSLI